MKDEAKTASPQNRSLYIDLLRIAAAFGVTVLHAAAYRWDNTPVRTLNWQVMNVYDSLVRWVVPVFVMISGVFHLAPNKKETGFNEEFKVIVKKIIRIVCAIVFWGVFYNLFTMATGYFFRDEPITVYELIKIPESIIFGPPYYHLWFLYMLLGLYLLTPVFRCFVSCSKREHIEYLLILFFIIGTGVPFINKLLDIIPVLSGRIFYFPAPEISGYIGYYAAGYYFANYEIKNKTRTAIYILAIVSLIFTIAMTSFLSLTANEPAGIFYDYILPNTMFTSFAIFLLFKDVFKNKNYSAKKTGFISKLSRDTFGIFLIHAFVLEVLSAIGLNTLIINPVLSIPIISLIVMVVSEIGTLTIRKIPVLSKYVL